MPRASMLIALAALAAAGAASAAAELPITVCNGMKVDLTGIGIDDVAAIGSSSAPLHPGDCVTLPALPPGAHTLSFVEQAGQSAALCARKLSLVAGAKIRITPDDGSRCMQ